MTDTAKKGLSITAIIAAVGLTLTCIGTVWRASASASETMERLRQQQNQISDHETRIRAVERTYEQTAADVRWIRQSIERRQP